MPMAFNKDSILKNEDRDEQYTNYKDIDLELKNYKEYLKGKNILLPCDWDTSIDKYIIWDNDIEVGGAHKVNIQKTFEIISSINKEFWKGNFIKFFVQNAKEYGINSLYVSGYNPKDDSGVRFQDLDFAQFDIVITNPPFSQITELIIKCLDSKIQFLTISADTVIYRVAITPFFVNRSIQFGYNPVHLFAGIDGEIKRYNNIHWLTNMPVKYTTKEKILTKKYSPDLYPNYLNFNGIECSRVKNIPYDYEGYIGVPTTFVIPDKNNCRYDPEQFEFLGFSHDFAGPIVIDGRKLKKSRFYIEKDGEPKALTERCVIRNRKVN